MDELVDAKSATSGISMTDFESLFVLRAIRTWADWESLDDANCTVRAAVLTDVEALRRCQTVWYRSRGRRSDWRDQKASRVTVGDESDRVDLQTLDRRLLDVPHVFPALDLGGGQLMLLDGNHRAAALAALRDPLHVLLLVLTGPPDPMIFPDLIHETHRFDSPRHWRKLVAKIDQKFLRPEVDPVARPKQQAIRPLANDRDIKDLMEVYGKRLDNEHALISSRMSWLLTLDSFLVAILGVTLANLEKLGEGDLAFWLVWAVSAIGVLTNSSCLFSNYWGGRAIDEASRCATRELASLTGSLPTELSTAGRRWLARLRLYGRDPRSEPERSGFWRPPSGVVHPWFMVPLVFAATFAVVPLALARAWQAEPLAVSFGWACVVMGPFLLTAFALFDFDYHRRRSGLRFFEYIQLRWYRWQATNDSERARRERVRSDNRNELNRLRARSKLG